MLSPKMTPQDPLKPKNSVMAKQFAPLVTSAELWFVRYAHIRHFKEPSSKNRPKMTNISQFSNETDVYLNHFSSDKF